MPAGFHLLFFLLNSLILLYKLIGIIFFFHIYLNVTRYA